MKAKISTIQPNGDFTTDRGKFYKFIYEFSDGTKMEANHKTQVCPFKQGDEVEYEITKDHPTYGNRVRYKSQSLQTVIPGMGVKII